MPKIGNSVSSSELPCPRCGSKRRVSKIWTEKLTNNNGFMTLGHKQIVCTNKGCQAEFEILIRKDMEKRAKLFQDKQDRLKVNLEKKKTIKPGLVISSE